MTNIVKLRETIDYTDLSFWDSEDAAGLKYFLNKAIIKKLAYPTKKVYNKGIDGKADKTKT